MSDVAAEPNPREEDIDALRARRWQTLAHLAEARGASPDPFVGALKAAARDREAGLDITPTGDADALLAEAEEAETLARTAEAERDAKRGPYEADPLFMYLWREGYGTPAYEARGITRRIDGWVAGLIGYRAARADYHILLQRPERLRRHAERLRARANDDAGAAERAARDLLATVEPGSPWRAELDALDARIAVLAAPA